jgi:hypothetical protein
MLSTNKQKEGINTREDFEIDAIDGGSLFGSRQSSPFAYCCGNAKVVKEVLLKHQMIGYRERDRSI